MSLREEALQLHIDHQGKLEVRSKVPVKNRQDLSLAYTPGVAEPCKEIHEKPETIYQYTAKGNMVAVVSDGSAVLGLGNIGGPASLPVMEGKAVLFKGFGGVDAFPICVHTQDPDTIVDLVTQIEPSFGGINLEDIAAPNCFDIERRLKETLNIPVFHDDQHGTAIVTLAALINALKITGKAMSDLMVVINGAGSAGVAIAKILINAGVGDILLLDRKGILCPGRAGMNWIKEEMAAVTNKHKRTGNLAEALEGADVFVGVSEANIVTKEMVQSMNREAILFAMANPVPEIDPDLAREAGARVIGTGRSDYANQINNVLAFPGVFRGALDVMARDINEAMKLAAAQALADLVPLGELTEDYIIPLPFNREVAPAVAAAVAQAAMDTGVARVQRDSEWVRENARQLIEKANRM